MEEMQFSKGMEVEICSDDVGLRGAWFTATVLRSNRKRKLPLRRKGYQSNEREKVYVEYHTLLANEKGTKRLREYVDVINLRPIPPREVDRSFSSSDEVDAYYNDGWWEGVVIRVLENCRYLVYFRSGKEEIEFGQSDLRIHREWVKGSWMPPMEEEEKVEEEAGVPQVSTVEDKEAGASQVSSMEDKAEEAKKLQGNQISLEDGNIQAFDTRASAPDPGSSCNLDIISDSYNASVNKDEDIEHNQVDGRRSDQVNVSLVYNSADAGNESNTRMENIKQPTPKSNKISQSCKKLKQSEVTEGCLILNIDINKAIPSTSPLEGLSEHPARSLDQENSICVLNCDGFLSHLTLSEFSLSPLPNIGEKDCESSKTQVEYSQQNIVDQPTPLSSQCPDRLEHDSCNKKRRRGPRKQSQILLDPLLPSGDLRCRRTGKGWRCRENSLPEKIYCEKHQLEQVIHNEKRRKGPKRESRFAMDPLLPSGHPQCRRTGKGWRCTKMASPQKLYCEKHQLEQDTYNEKRRKRRLEHISVVASESDKSRQNNSGCPLPSDDQQCNGVVRYDANQHEGKIGGHETANLKTRGHSETSANGETRGESEEILSEAPAKGEQPTANLETRILPEEMVSEASAQDRLEQDSCNKKRRRGPRKQSQILLDPLLPSGDLRCRRTGKEWRCRENSLPEKIYCEKHQLEQVIHNEKRRKGPKRESRFAMDPLLPSGHPQCRRTGKGWRCTKMASPQKLYCEKHQLEQDTCNEKRRKRRGEHISVVASESDKSRQNNSGCPLPSDDQQCSGVVRYDANQHEGKIGGHETANLKTRGHSETSANGETRGESEEILSEAPAKGEQPTANLETRILPEEMVSEASAQDPFLGIALEFHHQTPLPYPVWGPDYQFS